MKKNASTPTTFAQDFGKKLQHTLPYCVEQLLANQAATNEATDEKALEWLGKMVAVSWRRHGLLPPEYLSKIEKRVNTVKALHGYVSGGGAHRGANDAQTGVQNGGGHQAGGNAPSSGGGGGKEGHYPAERRGRIQQILGKLMGGTVTPTDREEILTIPEILEAIKLQKKGRKEEAQSVLTNFKLSLEHADMLESQQGPDPKKRKINNAFSKEWAANFIQKKCSRNSVTGKIVKSGASAEMVGRQILQSVSDQRVAVTEMHHNEVFLMCEFIYNLEKHIKMQDEVSESHRMPTNFTSLKHPVLPKMFLKSLVSDKPYQCLTCGLRFPSKNLLNTHYDDHFKKTMEHNKRNKLMDFAARSDRRGRDGGRDGGDRQRGEEVVREEPALRVRGWETTIWADATSP